MKVKLDDVIEQILFASESHQSYFNKNTGEIHLIPDEVESFIEFKMEDDFIPEWEKELIPIAKDIQSNPDNYIPLPDKYDINEYSIMEEFCISLDNEELREIMYSSIKGKGAFQRFKNNIHNYGITDEWYKFKDEALKEIAIEWCEYNSIEYY